MEKDSSSLSQGSGRNIPTSDAPSDGLSDGNWFALFPVNQVDTGSNFHTSRVLSIHER